MSKEDSDEVTSKRPIALIVGLLVILCFGFWFIFGRTRTYEVTFDSDGGTAVESQEVRRGDVVERPEDPTREGYNFAAWYLDGYIYDFEAEVTEDITLVARWVREVATPGDDEEETPVNGNGGAFWNGGWLTGWLPPQQVTPPAEEVPPAPVLVVNTIPNQVGVSWGAIAGHTVSVSVMFGGVAIDAVPNYDGVSFTLPSSLIVANGAGVYTIVVSVDGVVPANVVTREFTVSAFVTLSACDPITLMTCIANESVSFVAEDVAGTNQIFFVGDNLEFDDLTRVDGGGNSMRYALVNGVWEAQATSAELFIMAVQDDQNKPVVRLMNSISNSGAGAETIITTHDLEIVGDGYMIDFGLIISGAFDVAISNLGVVIDDAANLVGGDTVISVTLGGNTVELDDVTINATVPAVGGGSVYGIKVDGAGELVVKDGTFGSGIDVDIDAGLSGNNPDATDDVAVIMVDISAILIGMSGTEITGTATLDTILDDSLTELFARIKELHDEGVVVTVIDSTGDWVRILL